jgi:hypothetical protein
VSKLGRKLVPVKWIFKIKEDHGGLPYKSRSVVKGYMQIPGMDLTESFLPLAKYTTIGMIIGIFLYQLNHKNEDWVLEIFGVEAAFLGSSLPKRIIGKVNVCGMARRNCGVGGSLLKKYYIQLDSRVMYKNVDASLQWMIAFSKHLKENGLTQSKVDPCLFYSNNENGEIDLLLTLFVDDTL